MKSRKFFLLSLALAIAAVGLQLMATAQTSCGLQIRVRAVTATEPERIAAKAEAASHTSRGLMFGYLGLLVALGSAATAIASARRREPARRVAVVGVLVCYLMLQFVSV